MRILAGRYKGLSIQTVAKAPYRPTKSRVRKSIFDKITPFHYQSVLDCFSGSGILGFESASRGASHITFVEKHRKTFSLLKKNCQHFQGAHFFPVFKDVFKYLANTEKSFDLIFADPPYGKVDLLKLTHAILPLLNENGKFILECESGEPAFLGAISSDYGDTRILTWTKT